MGRTQQRSCWICRRFAPDNTQYDMTRSITSLGKAAALDPRKELRSLHSCSGQAVLKDSSSGFNMYREPAYSPALSIADQHPGLLNMLRSPIFALGTLGVGESSDGGLAPHHWHFSHPAFVMAGLRITEVPFVKYRTIELFCFQRTELYRKSSEFRASEKLSL